MSFKKEYPTFARTAPPDSYLYLAVIALLNHYKWKHLGVIGTSNDKRIETTKVKLVKDLRDNKFKVYDKIYVTTADKNKTSKFFKGLKDNIRGV